MDEPRVRIRDIAEELGLSTATVSNVIHGKTAKISEETVQRVMERLEARQYIPHMAGILLAQNASKIIGVFVNDHEKYEGHTLEDCFISAALNSLSAEIEKSGLFMMVKQAKCAEEIIRFASMWNMDGIVVIGFCSQDYAYLRSHMRIPFVVYDGFCGHPERFFNISIDNYDGGHQVGRYFKACGHRHAICIADNETGVDRERIRGFCAGFAPGEATFLSIPMHKQARRRFYQEHLPVFRQASAVFAVSDYYAIDLMCFLQEQGITVPDEISIAGFDDIPMCQLVYPPLTTVKQDSAQRAALAIAKLREMKAGSDYSTEITLPVSLVIRGSTK